MTPAPPDLPSAEAGGTAPLGLRSRRLVERLARQLDLAGEQGGIVLAITRDQTLRRRVEVELLARLELSRQPVRLELEHGQPHLPARLERMERERPAGTHRLYLVEGLSSCLLAEGGSRVSAELGALNLRREVFSDLGLAVLLWLDRPENLEQIRREAADFWAFRSDVTLFFSLEDLLDLQATRRRAREEAATVRSELDAGRAMLQKAQTWAQLAPALQSCAPRLLAGRSRDLLGDIARWLAGKRQALGSPVIASWMALAADDAGLTGDGLDALQASQALSQLATAGFVAPFVFDPGAAAAATALVHSRLGQLLTAHTDAIESARPRTRPMLPDRPGNSFGPSPASAGPLVHSHPGTSIFATHLFLQQGLPSQAGLVLNLHGRQQDPTPWTASHVSTWQGALLEQRGDIPGAMRALASGWETSLGSSIPQASDTALILGRLLARSGEPAMAAELIRATLELVPPDEFPVQVVALTSSQGLCTFLAGDEPRALSLWHQRNSPREPGLTVRTLLLQATVASTYLKSHGKAEDLVRQAEQLAGTVDRHALAAAFRTHAAVLARQERPDEAILYHHQALAQWPAGCALRRAEEHLALGELHLRLGRPHRALYHGHCALGSAREECSLLLELAGQRLLARALSRLGDPEPGLAAARHALGLAEEEGLRLEALEGRLLLGALLAREGRLEEAEEPSLTAVEQARETLLLDLEARALLLGADLGLRREARQAARQDLEQVRSMLPLAEELGWEDSLLLQRLEQQSGLLP